MIDKRLYSRLTISRIVNIILVFLSYKVSSLLSKPIHYGNPINISIEPTTACNLRCPECPSGLRSFTRETGSLKQAKFESFFGQVNKSLLSLTFYFQGEPYLNPSFLKMVTKAEERGVYTMTSTNGHFLNQQNSIDTVKSGLSKIIISIDGTTQEVYEKYRISGKLDHALKGVENLVKAKRDLKSATPKIVFQFLVVSHNEHQIEEVKQLAKKLGVDEVSFKSAQIYNYKDGNPLIPRNEKYSRYTKNSNGKYSLKNKIKNECWKLWHSCVITWDGLVIPCCFDKDAEHVMGNLNYDKFSDIWKGKEYRDFRERLLKGRKEIEICSNCSEGCNVYISE